MIRDNRKKIESIRKDYQISLQAGALIPCIDAYLLYSSLLFISFLARFTNEASSLYNELGITNAKHRKKISLRATDIVLFGPPIKGRNDDRSPLFHITIFFHQKALSKRNKQNSC